MCKCDWDRGICTAPDTNCPHWIGTFCEMDVAFALEYPQIEVFNKMLNDKRKENEV